jgi:hypothetical protein
VTLTGGTITNTQIRDLRSALKRDLRAEKWNDLVRAETKADIETCTIALTDRRAMAYLLAGVAEGVQKARARCARILNDRSAK